jgi:transketolase
MMATAGLGKKLLRLGLQDTFAHGASRQYLMREYGLDAEALVRAVELLTQRSFAITPQELAQADLPIRMAQAENAGEIPPEDL